MILVLEKSLIFSQKIMYEPFPDSNGREAAPRSLFSLADLAVGPPFFLWYSLLIFKEVSIK